MGGRKGSRREELEGRRWEGAMEGRKGGGGKEGGSVREGKG